MQPSTADAIDALLPQTQCTRCGYPDCAAYAGAIAIGAAPINRCPPGGAATVAAIARLTGRAALPVDPDCGTVASHSLALVDESRCIGCTICLQVCPVDAIVGAPKRMHAVLEAWCSGCELCVAPCPVDCIAMVPAPVPWSAADAALARERHRAHERRLAHGERIADRQAGAAAPLASERTRRLATVAAAVERARARRAKTPA